MVCSATVVKDPAHPGKSNMVWTAGHCVHAGKNGGWYRNIAFVPSYNNDGPCRRRSSRRPPRRRSLRTASGGATGRRPPTSGSSRAARRAAHGASYDFAVIHVTPEKGSEGKSLEETVGSALPVDFNAPAVPKVADITATGYPAATPFDGQTLFQCADKPGRLSLAEAEPTMYRIGCTMTGGSSGGGWVAARLRRQARAGVEHLDRPGDGGLARGTAPGHGGQGHLRRGQQEVRGPSTSSSGRPYGSRSSSSATQPTRRRATAAAAGWRKPSPPAPPFVLDSTGIVGCRGPTWAPRRASRALRA